MSNAAYDLSFYENKKLQPLTVVKNEDRKQKKAFSSVFKIILTAVFVLAMASLMIYGNVTKTELTDKINEVKDQIKVVQSENNRLQAQFDIQLSKQKIEAEAIKLGLSEPDKDQYVYVSLDGGDKIVIPEKEKDNSEESGFYSFILEYFS